MVDQGNRTVEQYHQGRGQHQTDLRLGRGHLVRHDLVLAVGLRAVERCVGSAQQRVGLLALDELRDAEARRRSGSRDRPPRGEPRWPRTPGAAVRPRAPSSGVSGRSTANSSPPSRAGISMSRTCSRRASANDWRSSSPIGWPKRSFTRLKSSRSERMIEGGTVRLVRPISLPSADMNRLRLTSPVSSSVTAWRWTMWCSLAFSSAIAACEASHTASRSASASKPPVGGYSSIVVGPSPGGASSSVSGSTPSGIAPTEEI